MGIPIRSLTTKFSKYIGGYMFASKADRYSCIDKVYVKMVHSQKIVRHKPV